jgi:glutamine amidotransferase
MIALIDSGICNLASVLHALARVGARVAPTASAEQLRSADALILPGVGAFADGMKSLAERGLVEPIRAAARAGKPVLGICLGMQLLVRESDEHGRHDGLGLLEGAARRMVADQPGFRVPNIGWCDVTATKAGALYAGPGGAGSYYFVHSYSVETAAENVAGTIEFSGRRVVAAVERANVCGVQFHPEKSQDGGLDLLARWVASLPVKAVAA